MKRKKEFIIGLTVIIAILVIIFGIDYLKGINVFKGTNYYTASYTNVAGLAQSAPVTVNGFKVGLVRDIAYEYDNPGHIRVEIDLNKELQLPLGTKALIATDMLGTSTIELVMGHSDSFHKSGDSLIGENKIGLMSNVTDDLMPKIDSLLTSLNKVIGNPALTSAITRLDATMGNLEKSSAELSAVMTRMPAIAGSATGVLNSVKGISDNLTTVSADLSAVTSQLRNAPIDSTLNNVYQATASLELLLKELNSPNSTLGLLLHDTGLYDNLNNASASLDSLLRDVKKNPKRYISIKLL
ncbi:MAG: MlaD family protein [Paramuribaculum sp.]|nr:MlaD family protein [Paramuribaculum sp.]